ncbi:MAG: anhydro-N-acetylmuramic acid kinase [Bacteroidota bacterium]|nr:anhydro-N-acetylmuramic acid kinase [Bacteroidota bacterium]MDP4229597.1 anhydro-N-acetylmuramic acid kinase [Bacteroidota bacterium]MDP4236325.1 anhydro-N-acetylmuramic acid kinase [Bacteroidota bacterium]
MRLFSPYYIGIMTGTSMDAIDVVIARFGDEPEVTSEYSAPIPSDLRPLLMDLASQEKIDIDLFVRMHFILAQAYADAVDSALRKAGLSADDIRAIGLHGQTIRHLPKPLKISGSLPAAGATFQLGSGPALAALTGIDVISDFRSADITLGGEGAPLVPMFDYRFLRSESHNRIVLNIGGIANLTYLPAKCREEDVLAFDTGPGNMILDALAREYFGKDYDEGGALAEGGRLDEGLLTQLLSNQYFSEPPPKSTGRELFGKTFVERIRSLITENSLSPQDALRVATELTAQSIAQAFELLPQESLKAHPTEIIASGGGVKNIFLCKRIGDLLPHIKFRISDEVGIPSQAKEALAFALFAKAFLDGSHIHLPKTTGASKKIILGSLSHGK